MQKLRKFIILLAAIGITSSFANQVEAANPYSSETDGSYEDSRAATYSAPAIALGAVAVIAIVAIAVQNKSHHGHSHNH